MRYTKEHKITSRNGILSSALKLFSHRGFDNVSIDEVMTEAGLTRGAFYAHFKNKQELYSEAILSADFDDRKNISSLTDGKKQLKQLVSSYLEADYSNPNISPCPLAYLVTDVANREPEVRSAYARSFELLNLKIKNFLTSNEYICDEESILALTTMMIGSVAISRTVTDTEKTKLINSCKKIAYNLIDNA